MTLRRFFKNTLIRLTPQARLPIKQVMVDEKMSKKTRINRLKTAFSKFSIFCHWK